MNQTAPDPEILRILVGKLRYKPGWRFTLRDTDRGQGSVGLTLCIYIQPPDAYHPGENRPVVHYMPVPPAAFNRQSWERWLLDQILLVERHEACEFLGFDYEDGAQPVIHPFAPNHGPGWDPYIVSVITTDLDRHTSFRGDVNPGIEPPHKTN